MYEKNHICGTGFFVFSDTIINNIKLGEEIGDEKIKLLAKK